MEITHLKTSDFEMKFGSIDRANRKFDYSGIKPVLIDFYATWCGPCRMFAPVFAKMAELYGNRVEFYKIDIDSEPDLAARLSVRSIPTLLFIKPNGEYYFSQGAMNAVELKSEIDSLLLR